MSARLPDTVAVCRSCGAGLVADDDDHGYRCAACGAPYPGELYVRAGTLVRVEVPAPARGNGR